MTDDTRDALGIPLDAVPDLSFGFWLSSVGLSALAALVLFLIWWRITR